MVHALVVFKMSALLAASITYLMPVIFPSQVAAAAAIHTYCPNADIAWVERDEYLTPDGVDGFVAICQWEK